MQVDRADPGQAWYRHRWPWLLMAGPALVVIAGIFTLLLAIRSDDGLVADDYYRQGLAINQLLRRDQLARELGVSAAVNISEEQVRVLVRPAQAASPVLRLRLAHPTRAGEDREVVLVARGDGLYTGELVPVGEGTRQLVLEDPAGGWRITGTWKTRQDGARLEAAR
jgi:hypothetical protein